MIVLFSLRRRIGLFKKEKATIVIENEKTPVYTGAADQAYQIARQDGMSLSELAKIKL